MNEKNQKTFGETQLSDYTRKMIVSALKEEGFNEEQLNTMAYEKVWNLYIDSMKKVMSDEIAKLAKTIERNPKLASEFSPLIGRVVREMEDIADSVEKELDKKKEKEKDKS